MITSIKNQNMKHLIQLNQKAKARREQGLFVAEGLKMFLEAPVTWIREVYLSESFVIQKEVGQKLCQCMEGQPGRTGSCRIETVSEEVFRKVCDTMTPQGILCVAAQPHYDKKKLLAETEPLWILLEDLQDPGNMGTIIRTGEGAGITGVLLTKNCVDLFHPKTIRATMGSIYRVPFFYTDCPADEIGLLKEHGVRVYAAHLQGAAWYDEPSYCGGTAFLIGNEGNGLKPETAALADSWLKIPMQGKVESLNAASAASILMYEAARQRRRQGRAACTTETDQKGRTKS